MNKRFSEVEAKSTSTPARCVFGIPTISASSNLRYEVSRLESIFYLDCSVRLPGLDISLSRHLLWFRPIVGVSQAQVPFQVVSKRLWEDKLLSVSDRL